MQANRKNEVVSNTLLTKDHQARIVQIAGGERRGLMATLIDDHWRRLGAVRPTRPTPFEVAAFKTYHPAVC